MRILNNDRPWATIMIALLVVIAAGVGGGVVLWGNPGALTFKEYLSDLERFAIAVGILGIGRGIVAHGKHTAQASMTDDLSMLTSLADDGSGGVAQLRGGVPPEAGSADGAPADTSPGIAPTVPQSF